MPGRKPIHAASDRRPRPAVTSQCHRLVAIVVVLAVALTERADGADPVPTTDHVSISADFGFETGARGLLDSSRVGMLRRRVTIRQADTVLTAGQGIAWISRARLPKTGFRVLVYLENNVRLEGADQTHNRPVLLHELTVSSSKPTVRILRKQNADTPLNRDPLYRRATVRRQRRPDDHKLVTYQAEMVPAPMANDTPQRLRRVQLFPRTNRPFNVTTAPSSGTMPREKVVVITGGVNVVIDGVAPDKTQALFGAETVDLSADRVVIWTQSDDDQPVTSQLVQAAKRPFQVYMEGNIEVRSGGNVIRARRALYDAREHRGLMLDADLLAKLPGGRVPLRIRAEKIRKEGKHSFHAHNAWASTSPFGVPGYRLEARDVFLNRRSLPRWLATRTDGRSADQVPWIHSQNNRLLLGEAPLFFLPNLAGPADPDLNFPLRRVTFQQDNVFGFQTRTTWNLFSLLSIEPTEGVDWSLHADYFTDRGPLVGSGLTYELEGLLGMPGDVEGWSNGAYLYDRGVDNLGLDRRNLGLDSTHRGRGRLIHRHEVPGGFTIRGEVGYLSDRNLLEQYYEEEFDEQKDQDTMLRLEQLGENTAWTLLAQMQLNGFETTTEWLPRGDIYVFSQPLMDNLPGWPALSWSTHTSAGYARLRPADAPLDPTDVFAPLADTAGVGGAVLMSRHELSMPVMLGPTPLVPYVMAESAYWSEGMSGTEIDRHLFSGGLRGSLSMWRADPGIRSSILGLNGLAHKMTFETDLAWTETTRALGEIPQYNAIDDNAQERFRYRLLTNSFGGVLPTGFDTRSVAVRNGAGLGLTAPWHELVADQQAMRMAWRHRLQTKVGAPGRQRIRNWMTLDLEATWFPKPDRDNFGEDFGLLGAAYRWHVSDRTTLLADAYMDLFDDAPEMWNLGLLSQRTSRGTLFANLRQIRAGVIDSQIVTAGLSYRMSPKWVSTLATAYDLAENRNQGQSLTLTRIGGDFLVHLGASYDNSRGTAGFQLSVEPRFGAMNAANPQLGRLLGLQN